MALAPGTRLGVYEILAAIGEGGMGAVYRATDTSLSRQVAIKVLPEAFATDPDRLARFEREAKTLAALNHPNIAAIYGLERSSGTLALVMELVEGEDVSQRIARGAIPIDEALPIAKQIAEALEAAHEQGIVHRDLKPANIKVRLDGQVKVLDFGLAKGLATLAQAPGSRLQALGEAPTITSPAMTQAGMILGTAAYMSPEQARGKAVDKRADIWAFGCVVFEMLTGTRAFVGDDVSETLASVLRSEPDWANLPPETPPALHRLLHRCLAKDSRRRVADSAVVLYALEALSAGVTDVAAPVPNATTSVPPIRPSRRWSASIAILAGGAVLAAIAVVAVSRLPPAPAARPIVRLIATPPGGVVGDQTPSPDVAISPDGRTLAYTIGPNPGSNGALWVRPLDSLVARQVSGSSAAPAMSPDGQWVCFFEGAYLQKVAVAGGPTITIAAFQGSGRSVAWGPNDTIILASASPDTGLFRVNANGGTPEQLTTPDRAKGELDHLLPEFLPDGRSVLFTIAGGNRRAADAQVALLDLETLQYRVLIRGGVNPRYAASGHIVYAADGRLFAVRFDARRLQVHGVPVPVADRVVTKLLSSSFSIASNGTLAYLMGPDLGGIAQALVWVDRDGQEESVGVPPGFFLDGNLSPDGSKIVLSIRDQQDDFWIWDVALKTLTRLTLDPEPNANGVWSADGSQVAFAAGGSTIVWQSADGTGGPTPLTSGEGVVDLPYSFTPDGKSLLFGRVEKGQRSLFVTSVDGSGKALPLLQFDARFATISPDGRWMAYDSQESGQRQRQVFVRPFSNVDGGGRWPVAAGTRPIWARDGRELFFTAEDGAIMAVPVEPGPAFKGGTPRTVVKAGYRSALGVSPDVHRFLMMKAATDSAGESKQLVVVLNWLDELTRLVPEQVERMSQDDS